VGRYLVSGVLLNLR